MIAPRLIVVTDTTRGGDMVRRITEVCVRARGGTVLVQLRDKELGARQRLELGRELRAITRRTGQLLAVNDRIDLAELLDADALHLGEQSVGVDDARKLWGERSVLRASHDPSAGAGGADGVVLSPIIAPRHGAPALGLAALQKARSALGRVRLFALGGVDAGSARACLDAGADGVAVIGAVLDGQDDGPLLAALGTLTS